MPYEHVSVSELKKRFPMIHTEDLHHAWFDPYGGYLKARESCQAVKDAFVKEGGSFIQAFVKPGNIQSGNLSKILLSNGDSLQADAYIFACGSWLGQLFPEVLGNVITCTKQEAYYFGVPEADAVAYESMPAWVDVDGKDFYYGIPGNAQRSQPQDLQNSKLPASCR